MTKSQERKLNNAIFQLKRYYEHALGNGHIRHPLVWALYQTWFDEDVKARETEGKKCKVTHYCTDCVKMNTDGCAYHTSTPNCKACEDFLGQEELEVWNGMGGRKVIAPKGTFMKIYNDQDTESDSI